MTIYGFETGNFSNWTTIGNTSVQTTTSLSAPTEGNFQARITNGFASANADDLQQALGLNPGSLDSLGNGNVTQGSAIKLVPITVEAGDILTFDWNFQSNDGGFFNDFSFVSISSGGSSFFLDELADANNSTNVYQTFEYQFTTAGTYQIAVGVVDVIDAIVDSQLLIDNLRVFEEIVGTSGNDFLNGTGDDERIKGLGGDDQINGNGGHDILLGGAGNDTIAGASQKDYIDGGSGNDQIFGNGGEDTLIGGSGSDTIFGASQADRIFGGDGNDLIYANGGDDLVDGGNGNDEIWLGGGETVVLDANDSGFDTIRNFQLGQTTFVVNDLNSLNFADSSNGAEIYQGGNLLAVVSWQSASTFANNVNDIFVAA
ncbi:MAG: calcium-binding protein [Symploca sp. SIO1C2]|nr:calcium-binding protein [Symploca sp. SIO1C2]